MVRKNLLTKTVQEFAQKRIYTFENLKNKTFSSILKKKKKEKKDHPKLKDKREENVAVRTTHLIS